MNIEVDSDLAAKQKYYEYDPSAGGHWWVKDEPTPPSWFEEELTEFAGLEDGRRPRLRVVWGGTVMHDITEKPQLKYKVVREINEGFYYLKQDGSTGTTLSMNLPTDAAVPWKFHPKTRRIEIGRLRWVIERHVPAHELRRLGRFQNRKAPNGEVILRELPPEGIYEHFFWVQTRAHKYRDLDREVLTAVQAMYLYNITTSEAQKALDQMEEDKNKTLLGAEEARAIWQDLKAA